MSEGFRITGPGRYRTRRGDVVTIRAWEYPGSPYKWIDDCEHAWLDDGGYLIGQPHTMDIIARVDVPQPDAQDRIVGVEQPKPLGPLTRLEAWRLLDPANRDYQISSGSVSIEFDEVTISTECDTVAEAITKALDIAEGIK